MTKPGAAVVIAPEEKEEAKTLAELIAERQEQIKDIEQLQGKFVYVSSLIELASAQYIERLVEDLGDQKPEQKLDQKPEQFSGFKSSNEGGDFRGHELETHSQFTEESESRELRFNQSFQTSATLETAES